jgi:hypothetical protein
MRNSENLTTSLELKYYMTKVASLIPLLTLIPAFSCGSNSENTAVYLSVLPKVV